MHNLLAVQTPVLVVTPRLLGAGRYRMGLLVHPCFHIRTPHAIGPRAVRTRCTMVLSMATTASCLPYGRQDDGAPLSSCSTKPVSVRGTTTRWQPGQGLPVDRAKRSKRSSTGKSSSALLSPLALEDLESRAALSRLRELCCCWARLRRERTTIEAS